jgi:UbiA prenyltransferase family
MTFLDFAKLTRLPNVFTAMADICLVWLAVDAGMERASCFLLLLLSSASLYLAGMVWNDYFDVQQDRKERPFRPLASGRVQLSTAFWLGSFLLILGVTLAWLADMVRGDGAWRSSVVAGLLVLAILAYDGWLKRTLAGPIAMGACRFLNIMLGLSLVSGAFPSWGWMLAFVVGVYITGVTWFAWTEATLSSTQQLMAAGALMLAGVLLSLALPAMKRNVDFSAAASLPVMIGEIAVPQVGRLLFPYLLVVFIFVVSRPVLRAIANPIPERVQAAVKRTILGLVFLDAILATALAGPVGLTILLLLLPARFLGRWVYST